MTSEHEITQAIQQVLPKEMHSYISPLVNLLISMNSGMVSQADVESQINSNPDLINVVNALSGMKITSNNATLQFGNNSQTGDITIRDVARGNITHLTINLFTIGVKDAARHSLNGGTVEASPSSPLHIASSLNSADIVTTQNETARSMHDQPLTPHRQSVPTLSSISHKSLPHTFTICHPVVMEFILIPGGNFIMGSFKMRNGYKREQPQHRVYISPFYIGKYPVNRKQYEAFVKMSSQQIYFEQDYRTGDNYAAIATWDAAIAFCSWLGQIAQLPVRLPTEAEWEKAARGTEGRLYPWGDSYNYSISRHKWSRDNNWSSPPLGTFSPAGDSPYGVADMSECIWQWCMDYRSDEEYKKRMNILVKDPQGPTYGSECILRGGSTEDGARCAYRYGGGGLNGFRLVIPVTSENARNFQEKEMEKQCETS